MFSGAAADKLQIHRLWSIICAILLNCLLLVPPVPAPEEDTVFYSTCAKHGNTSVTCSVNSAEDFTFGTKGNVSEQFVSKAEKILEGCSSLWNISVEDICSQMMSIIGETKDKSLNVHIDFDFAP